nr:hypothetical protein [Asanoa siamensis]
MDVDGKRGMRAVHADDVGQVAVLEVLAELRGVVVSGVSDGQRRFDTLVADFVDRLQARALRLLMSHVGRHRGPAAAFDGLGCGRVPRFRHEQAPVDRAGRGVGDQVQAHADLAVGDFPAVPVYCRATPTEVVPQLSQRVSSSAHAAGLIALSIRTARRSRTAGAAHGLFVT